MKTYTILHTHKHGADTYVFETERTDVPTGWHGSDTDPDDEVLNSLLAACGVDFEPDRDEYLDILELGETITVWF